MGPSATKFADLLTTAVRIIAARANKTIASVQDELGYVLGREGGSSIEYWRKGHIPADLADLEQLAGELVRRQGFTLEQCEQFLRSADHPEPQAMAHQLFPRVAQALIPSPPLPRSLSPFVAGLPITTPRQFFGRERELKRIFDLWRHFPLQSIAVMGLKRSGKTSLLHYLKTITQAAPTELRPGQRAGWLPRPEQYQWVFVDFQDTRLGNQERLLRYLLTSLNMPVPNPCHLDNFMDVFSAHLHHPTVILMDELSAGLASPELDEAFWGSLRSLVSHYTHGYLAFVLATPASLVQLAQDQGKPSPFFNIFYTLELGPLTDSEANELIGCSPQPFAPVEIEWILNQSGCWPCLLQILCQTHLAALAEGQAGETWRAEGLRQIEPFRYLLGT